MYNGSGTYLLGSSVLYLISFFMFLRMFNFSLFQNLFRNISCYWNSTSFFPGYVWFLCMLFCRLTLTWADRFVSNWYIKLLLGFKTHSFGILLFEFSCNFLCGMDAFCQLWTLVSLLFVINFHRIRKLDYYHYLLHINLFAFSLL